jgi:glyoxylase-like metal-dependent hydrolase (beta-lactamase superfamily II)
MGESCNTSRRQFLQAIGGVSVAFPGLIASGRNVYAQESSRALAMTELRRGLVQITGAGGNVVLLAAPEGLLIVDSGSPERAQHLKQFVAEHFKGAPVATLFNTHWHLEHTGGNELITEPDAVIIAHENTRLWMSTKFYVEWQDRRYLPRPPGARPTQTFFSSDPQPLQLGFGSEQVTYGHLAEAHTDGDIYVRFLERNVIVAGGAATAGTYPVLDYITGGWIGGLMAATQTLIGMADAQTLIVPESGSPRTRADLQAQYEMLSAVRERVETMALKGQGIDEMINAGLTKEFDARFGKDSAQFIENAYQGLWWNRMRAI